MGPKLWWRLCSTASIEKLGQAQFHSLASCTVEMTREQHSLTVAMDQTTVQKCEEVKDVGLLPGCLKQAFYKRQKNLIHFQRAHLLEPQTL